MNEGVRTSDDECDATARSLAQRKRQTANSRELFRPLEREIAELPSGPLIRVSLHSRILIASKAGRKQIQFETAREGR
jgi:hypothetical protein